MTQEEEIIYAQTEYKNGNQKPLEKLLNNNLALVRSIAKKYYSSLDYPQEDIIQIGTVALYRAIINFDATSNKKFPTFAYTVITNAYNKEYYLQNMDKRKINKENMISLDDTQKFKDDDGRSLHETIPDRQVNIEEDVLDEYIDKETISKLFKFLTIRERKIFEYLSERLEKTELKTYFNRTDRSLNQAVMLFSRKLKAITYYQNKINGTPKQFSVKFSAEDLRFGKQLAPYLSKNKMPSFDFVAEYGNAPLVISLIKKIVKNTFRIDDKQQTKFYYLRQILEKEEFEFCYKICVANKKSQDLIFDLNLSNAYFENLLRKTARKLAIAHIAHRLYYAENISKKDIATKFGIDEQVVSDYIKIIGYLNADAQSKLGTKKATFPVDIHKPTTYIKALNTVYKKDIFNNPEKLLILKSIFKESYIDILMLYFYENKSPNYICARLNLSKPQFFGKLRAIKFKLSRIYSVYDMVNNGHNVKEIGEKYNISQSILIKQFLAASVLFSGEEHLPVIYVNDRNVKTEQFKKFIFALPLQNRQTLQDRINAILPIFSKQKQNILINVVNGKSLKEEENRTFNKIIIRLKELHAVYVSQKLGETNERVYQILSTIDENKKASLLNLAKVIFENNEQLTKTYKLQIATNEENINIHRQKLKEIWKGFDLTNPNIYPRMKDVVTKECFDSFKLRYVDGKQYYEHDGLDGKTGKNLKKMHEFFERVMKHMSFCYFNYKQHGENWVAEKLGIRPEWVSIYYTRANHLISGEPLQNDKQRGLLRIKEFFEKNKTEEEIKNLIHYSLTQYEEDVFYLYFIKQFHDAKIKEIICEKYGPKPDKTFKNIPRYIIAKIKKNCYSREESDNNIN